MNGQIERTGGRCFAYMFFQSRILYWKMKLQNKSLRGTSARDFRFAPLPKAGLLDLYRKSRAVIDIQHPRQMGLTMRCIETMGAKRKLITTNGHIAEYDFYDPNNILIVDRRIPSCRPVSRPLPTGTYLSRRTTAIGSTAGSKRFSNHSTGRIRHFDERRILRTRGAVCICRQPLASFRNDLP